MSGVPIHAGDDAGEYDPSRATVSAAFQGNLIGRLSTGPAALVRLLEEKLGAAPFTIVFGQTECSPGRGANPHPPTSVRGQGHY